MAAHDSWKHFPMGWRMDKLEMVMAMHAINTCSSCKLRILQHNTQCDAVPLIGDRMQWVFNFNRKIDGFKFEMDEGEKRTTHISFRSFFRFFFVKQIWIYLFGSRLSLHRYEFFSISKSWRISVDVNKSVISFNISSIQYAVETSSSSS